MKKITLILLAAVGILFSNCKTKSKATSSSDSSSTATKDVKVQCRVAVSFISFASGIDGTKYDEIENFIKNHPKKPAFDVIPMGREGERDICMGLKEMNKDEQKAFIEELNKLAKTSDRVKVNENQERVKRP